MSEHGQAALRGDLTTMPGDLTKLRTDLMARMDQHANQLTMVRDDIAVAIGLR